MKIKNLGLVGVGLIGGSMAKDLIRCGFAEQVIGYDANEMHLEEALQYEFIHRSAHNIEELLHCDLIILAIPVNQTIRLLPDLLNQIGEDTTVIDVGSTKASICETVKNHPARAQFVATHPIAGTENSGPSAAIYDLFKRKVNIICDSVLSGKNSLELAVALYEALDMQTFQMSSSDHDVHIAYVSHLSHISSFTLGLTVLEIEKNEENIFRMAGSGFASTARLAKSSPDMWTPIFMQNSSAILTAIDAYTQHLFAFREAIANQDADKLRKLMTDANHLRKVLDGIR